MYCSTACFLGSRCVNVGVSPVIPMVGDVSPCYSLSSTNLDRCRGPLARRVAWSRGSTSYARQSRVRSVPVPRTNSGRCGACLAMAIKSPSWLSIPVSGRGGLAKRTRAVGDVETAACQPSSTASAWSDGSVQTRCPRGGLGPEKLRVGRCLRS